MMSVTDRIARQIREAEWTVPAGRPRLLFGPEEVPLLRERAAARHGVIEAVRSKAEAAMATPANEIDALMAYRFSAAAVDVASAYVLTGDRSLGPWLKGRVDALLALDTWFCHVHVGTCRICDHVMCNLAADVALVHDLAADLFTQAEVDHLAAGLRRLHLEPFLDATEGAAEWWFAPGVASNWKIMCCGETGLAVCGYLERWPEAREVLARAARGVSEVLDLVPAEGDWGEGVGYWFATLWMGLRYALALRRLSGRGVNLFEHPALRVTGDFMTQLMAPSGRVYNFGDGDAQVSARLAEALLVLAAEQGRPDWMHAARLVPQPTPLFLAVDTPDQAARPSDRRVAAFPSCGAATIRAGWQPDDLFVGFRAGPSDVGHAHLDANSFVVEAGGRPLVIENGYWPQGHYLGFFDAAGPRWNFDGPGTVGHSTLLVDGQGQTWGSDYPGRLLVARDEGRYLFGAGDAAAAYPGLLRQFVRAFLVLPPDILVVHDRIECEGERHLEWLIHYAGDMRTDGIASHIENDGARLCLVPFLPDRDQGWRWSDVIRTSLYRHSDSMRMVSPAVRYRSFSPFRKAGSCEFLMAFRANGRGEEDWRFTGEAGNWTLEAVGTGACIVPAKEGLRLR